MRPALPERELVFLWAVGWAFSAQGLLVATFEPWIGYLLAAAGWLLLPIGMYRILRRAGYDLVVGSLIVLLVGWLVGLLAIVQAFDSSSVLARSLRDWRPEGELLARYLSIGIAGVAVGFSTSAIVVGRPTLRCAGVGLVWALLFYGASIIAIFGIYGGMLLQVVMGAVAGQVTAHLLVGGLLGAAVAASGNRLLRGL